MELKQYIIYKQAYITGSQLSDSFGAQELAYMEPCHGIGNFSIKLQQQQFALPAASAGSCFAKMPVL